MLELLFLDFINSIVQYKYLLLITIIMFSTLTILWNSKLVHYVKKDFNSIQNVHNKQIPRLGGFFILISFYFTFILYDSNELFSLILLSSIPIFVFGLLEDLIMNIKPFYRLAFMTFSCFIFFFFSSINFPNIDVPYFSSLFDYNITNYIFFIFSSLIIINGENIIDGMNGLAPFTIIGQILLILCIGYKFDDEIIINLGLLLLLPMSLFLLFNFPNAKIFLGDLGSYFFGFSISMITIYIFGKYENLLTWLAVLILFYPSCEILFSFLRRILNNKSPFVADDLHLHSLIFKYLNKKLNLSDKYSNPLSTLFMSIFWFIVPLCAYWSFDKEFYYVISLLIFFFILYISLYYFFYKSR